MNITLINAVRIAGIERAAGTPLTVDDALGADLVRRGAATDNNPPSFEVPVTARTSVTGGVEKIVHAPSLNLRRGLLSVINKPTMMGVGNSIMRAQRRNGMGGGANQIGGYGWLWWAMSFLGWPLDFILTGEETQIGASSSSTMCDGVYGYSGGTSVDILAQLPTAIGTNRPSVLFVHAMENDVTAIDAGSITTAQAAAAYDGILSYADSIGAAVVWIGCLPSSDYSTAGKKAAYYTIDQSAQLACLKHNAIYVPVWDLYSDATSTYPIPLNSGAWANMVYTNVHPMQAGVLIGARVADVLARCGYDIINEPVIAFPASTKFIHGNARCDGSGGTLSGGYTGSAPANTTITNDLTSPTATSTITTTGGGQTVGLSVSAGTQTGTKVMAQIYNATYGTTGYSIGDIVSSFIDLKLNSYTALRTIEMQTVFQGATASNAYTNIIASGDDVALPIPLNRRMRIITPKVAVPVGTTGIRETAKIFAKTAAAACAVDATLYGYGVINHSA